MRIAVSGTHCSGKSTLINEFLAAHPEFTYEPEPFVTMVEEYGEEFSHIRITSRMFSDELAQRGIPHVFEVYRDGDHSSKVRERIETRLLPAFSRALDFGP